MSTWGVGCFRSGTMSLAEDLEGEHEPLPRILDISDTETAHSIIENRYGSDVPVVDAAQSAFMEHIIDVVDPEPKFVWIVRDPLEVVASLYFKSSILTECDENGWRSLFFDHPGSSPDERLKAFAAHWRTWNERIYKFWDEERGDRIVSVYDLDTRSNYHPARGETHFNTRQARIVMGITEDLWTGYRVMLGL